LRLAQAFSISGPLHEVIGKWSHREYRLRLEWLAAQNNEPSRSDFYLMQIAAEVRRVLHKTPNSVKTDDFQLKFSAVEESITETNAKQRANKSKSFFGSLISMATRKKKGK